VKYGWIKDHRREFEVVVMCDVLDVSRSAFYAWCRAPLRRRQAWRDALAGKIAAVQRETRGVYGSPRITAELKARGTAVSENTVARCMKERGIRAKTARRYVPATTDSRHHHPVADNLLDQTFAADSINQKWVCDITYIPTGEGWLYLAAVMDLCSRRIVGWSMADHLRTDLVHDALSMALVRRHPPAGLLHHSDRGCQYACGDYQAMLADHGLTASMSRAGNCYDNAAMESLFGTLKTELVNQEHYPTREAARRSVFEYIEVFYNRVRRHSSLGYVSPECFEAALN
jgi:putative transposase